MITNRTIWLVWVEPTDDDLLKGLSHKYLKRLPTGKQRPKWRYIYQLPKTKGLTASDDLVAGAKFKGIHRGQEGHYEVLEHLKDKGLVHVRHDESGKEAHFKEHDLHAAIKAETTEVAQSKEHQQKAEYHKRMADDHFAQAQTKEKESDQDKHWRAGVAHNAARDFHAHAAKLPNVYVGMSHEAYRKHAAQKSAEAEKASAKANKAPTEKSDRKPRSKWGAAEKTAAAEEHKHKAAEHDAAAEALPGGIGGGKETHQHAAILHRQAAEAAKGAKKDYRRAADQAERSSEFAHGMHPIKKSLYGLDAATIRHHGALPFALGAPVRDNMNKSRDSRTLPELAPCTEENMKKSKAAPSLQQTIRDFGPLPFPIDEAAVIKMREYEVQPVITPHTFSENIPADIIDGVADLGPKSGAGGQAGEDDENDRSQIFAEPEVVIVQNTPGAQRGPFGSSY